MTVDARAHLELLVGQELRTVTGRPTKVLSVGGAVVLPTSPPKVALGGRGGEGDATVESSELGRA